MPTSRMLALTLIALSGARALAAEEPTPWLPGERVLARCDRVIDARVSRGAPPVREAHFVLTADDRGRHAVREVPFPQLGAADLRATLNDHGRLPSMSAACTGKGECVLQNDNLRIREVSRSDRHIVVTTAYYDFKEHALYFMARSRTQWGFFRTLASISVSCVPTLD